MLCLPSFWKDMQETSSAILIYIVMYACNIFNTFVVLNEQLDSFIVSQEVNKFYKTTNNTGAPFFLAFINKKCQNTAVCISAYNKFSLFIFFLLLGDDVNSCIYVE